MTKNGTKPETSRLPPQDLSAEKALLGSILLDQDVIDDVSLIVKAADFYLDVHGRIFEAAAGLHNGTHKVDAVTIVDALQKAGKATGATEEVFTALMESVHHAGHAAYYARIVAEKAARRAVEQAGIDAQRDAHDNSLETDQMVARFGNRLNAILERRAGQDEVDLNTILIQVLNRISEKRGIGLMSGFRDLDELTNGFQDGNFVVVGARPSMGKTSWVGSLALNVARRGEPVGFLSLEQSRTEIAERFLSAESGVSMHVMRKSELSIHQTEELLQAAARLDKLPIVVDDCHDRTMAAIEAKTRLMKRRDGIKLLVVDFIQLIWPADRRVPREQQVAEISQRLKLLGISLGIPVVVLAQLNREVEKRVGADKRPRLSDLRESGSLEQDADVVLFLHRPEYYDINDRPGEAEVIISKQRNGPRGTVRMLYQKQTMAFSDTETPDVGPQMVMPFGDEQHVETG